MNNSINKQQITYENINNFVYLTQIIKESLRLHPAAPTIARTNTDITEIGGFK